MRSDEIGSVRFQKVTEIVMIRVEAYDSSNVNDPRDRREVVTVLASKAQRLTSHEVSGEIEKVIIA